MYYSARGSTPTVVAAAKGGVCKSALPRLSSSEKTSRMRADCGRKLQPPPPETVKPPETRNHQSPET